MTVDASVVTNRKNLIVGSTARSGTLVIQNGAYFRQTWASKVGVGGKGDGVLNVLNGSTFDAGGADFYLGVDGDVPSGDSKITVSNSTFMVRTFVAPRYTNYSKTYTLDIVGPGSVFSASGDFTMGPVAQQAGTCRSSGNTKVNVKDGTVSVGGWLNVGGGSIDQAMNYLTVSGAMASMNLGTLNCRTNATLKFVVPEKGFENAAIISATNRIQLAEGMPPITVDATECKNCAWVSLLAAEKGITNLTEENLASRVVLAEKDGHLTKGDRPYEFKLVTDSSGESPIVTALKFRVGSMGLAILIR